MEHGIISMAKPLHLCSVRPEMGTSVKIFSAVDTAVIQSLVAALSIARRARLSAGREQEVESGNAPIVGTMVN